MLSLLSIDCAYGGRKSSKRRHQCFSNWTQDHKWLLKNVQYYVCRVYRIIQYMAIYRPMSESYKNNCCKLQIFVFSHKWFLLDLCLCVLLTRVWACWRGSWETKWGLGKSQLPPSRRKHWYTCWYFATVYKTSCHWLVCHRINGCTFSWGCCPRHWTRNRRGAVAIPCRRWTWLWGWSQRRAQRSDRVVTRLASSELKHPRCCVKSERDGGQCERTFGRGER